MNFICENQSSKTYLVYHLETDDKLDTVDFGMTKNNKIDGMIPILFTQLNNEKYLKYDITSKVTLKQFFAGTVNKKQFLGVFSTLVAGIINSQEYMIDISSILFDQEYIFVNVSSCEASMLCLPVANYKNHQLDLKAFFKNIVFNTQFNQTENCNYVVKTISFLNSPSQFSLLEFKKVLSDIETPETSLESDTKEQPLQLQTYAQQNAQSQIVTQPGFPSAKAQCQKAFQYRQPINKFSSVNPDNLNVPYPKAVPAATYPTKSQCPTEKQKKAKKQFGLFNHKKGKCPNTFAPQKPENCQRMTANISSGPTFLKADSTTNSFAGQKQSALQSMPNIPNVNQREIPASANPNPHPDFGETTILESISSEGTTVLTANKSTAVKPYLIRCKNNEKIYIEKPMFRIGKEKSYVDYFICDNAAISRSHANIIFHDGDYFITDTNSTNHTYLNGVMLKSNTEYKLSHGSKIRFANDLFEFMLY